MALLAVILFLAACSGQPTAEDASAPKAESAVAAPTNEATEGTGETDEDAAKPAAASVEGFPLTIEDRLGREFTFDAPPERIVCFYNGCMRGLGALGYPVAFPEESDLNAEFTDAEYYPDFAENVTVLARPGGDIDAEAVAEFQPDLIIAYGEDEITSFEAIAPVFAEYDPDTVDGVIESFINYGRIVGLESEAQSLVRRVLDRLEAYKMLSPNDVSFMTVGNEGDVLWLRTQNSAECQVLEGIAQCDCPTPPVAQAGAMKAQLKLFSTSTPMWFTWPTGRVTTVQPTNCWMLSSTTHSSPRVMRPRMGVSITSLATIIPQARASWR
jgi:ABC-type Fe3+-hydroxamate transport system substrate-binding protein